MIFTHVLLDTGYDLDHILTAQGIRDEKGVGGIWIRRIEAELEARSALAYE